MDIHILNREMAGNFRIAAEELLDPSGVWSPTFIRAQVRDPGQAIALARDLEGTFEVHAEVYSPLVLANSS